jgi:hypothetical protein
MILSESERDLLRSLTHFRLLSDEQIKDGWYRSHTPKGFRNRVTQLLDERILHADRHPTQRGRIFRLSAAGIRKLRQLHHMEIEHHRSPSPLFQRHLLETNEVCLRLGKRDDGVTFARLPFTWEGSHEVQLTFTKGGRNRRLRPDATVTPKQGAGARVFLELDRSTECIKKRSRRRSIEDKLETYGEFLHGRSIAGLRAASTWYETTFDDGRRPSLVFVLTKRDARSKLTAYRHRRIANIVSVARKVCPQVDLHCVYIDDVEQLRALFTRLLQVDLGQPGPVIDQPPPVDPEAQAWKEFLDSSLRLHRAIKAVYPAIEPGKTRDRFRDCANDFRLHLRRQRQLQRESGRTQ